MRYLLTLTACLTTILGSFALPTGFFSPKSALASGKWVKIAIDETGLYEIPFETLRNMGFSDPEKVGVYGRGGAMLDENFTTLGGSPTISNDLDQVATFALNGKLYFYAKGCDNIGFRSSSAYNTKGYFYRISKNIYSNKGYYFLSDKEAPKRMEVVSPGSTSTLTPVNAGISYYNHEVDLVQNNSETGQLFFGEKLTGDNSRLEWKLTLPGAVEGTSGAMECFFYCDRDIEGHFKYGVEGAPTLGECDVKTFSTTNFRAQDPTIVEMEVTGEQTTVYTEFSSSDNCDIAHLDYWTLTYQRLLPNLLDSKGNRLNQEFISLPTVTRGKSMSATFSNAASMVVLDISHPSAPKVLQMQLAGDKGTVRVKNEDVVSPELLVFDPLQIQKQIGSYENQFVNMENQDLHGQVADGADMIVIYVPSLKDEAMRLVDIHARLDGLKVVAASCEEVYNEFSQGIPDAMAYRSFIKMAYNSPNPVKNAILLGPIAADFRGIVNEKNPYEHLIAYQSNVANQLRGAMNANDFYGMMDDYLKESALEKNPVQVGIAVLPCRFPSEMATINDKVEEYLSRTDFAYFSNRMMNIGGVGDNHSHDKQAITMGSLVNNNDNRSTIITPLIVDAYGYDAGHEKFFSQFEDGSLMVTYFGHGSPSLLNHEGNFFRINDVFKLRNTFHPFMNFAGCELTNSDRGIRGLGEALLTSTPFGVIGTLLASRETWSGQNLEFFRSFVQNLYRNGASESSPIHEAPISIGEVFARTKSQSLYNNELAYLLMCDPSLKLPVVTRNISLNATEVNGNVGEFNDISGFVCDRNGDVDASYNGEVVIRLMEPFKTLASQNLASAESGEETTELDIVYADTQTAMTVAEVKDGKFSARLFIPGSMKKHKDVIGRLHLAAFDPQTRIVAGTMLPLYYRANSSTTSEDKDKTAPVISRFEYIEADNALAIEVSDNLALNFNMEPLSNGFIVKIDNRESTIGARHEATVTENGARLSKIVPLNDLAVGSHTAALSVSDAAGNVASREIVFTYNPARTRFAIELEDGVANGSARFLSVGTSPSASDLIILDASGMIVYRGKFTGSEFEWDLRDNAGNTVAPGLYKAYLLETGNFIDKGHSATIDVPVI